MVKFPISRRNYPMLIGSAGLILIGVGLGHIGIGQMVNSIWYRANELFGNTVTAPLLDTSISSVYISYGFALVIISALAYLVPRILNRH